MAKPEIPTTSPCAHMWYLIEEVAKVVSPELAHALEDAFCDFEMQEAHAHTQRWHVK